MRRPIPFALAALIALTASTVGCAPLATAPAVTPPFVDGRDEGDAQLVLTPDLGGPRTLLASAANVRANIDHVRLTLKRGATTVATYDVPKTKLDAPVVFGNLRAATTYTVLAAAYRDAAGTDLMSDAATSQVAVTLPAGFVQPTVARIPVRLTDVTFAGMAEAALAITDGLVGVDQPLAIAKTTWTTSTLAGDPAGLEAGTGDGSARVARFDDPVILAALPNGGLLVRDRGADALRLVSPAGDVATVPGSAGLNNLSAIAPLPYSGVGPPPFVGGFGNQIRRWIPKADGSGYQAPVDVAGNATSGYIEGDALSTARLAITNDLELMPNGDIYIQDVGNHCIRKYVAATRTVTTWAGTQGITAVGANRSGYIDAVGTAAAFNGLAGFAAAPDGTLYVVDRGNRRIRAIAPDRTVTTIAGTNLVGAVDGTGTAARFGAPNRIQRDYLGNLYVIDDEVRVRRIAPDHKVTTIAGPLTKETGCVDGVGPAVRFTQANDLAIAPDGTLFLVDYGTHNVRVVK